MIAPLESPLPEPKADSQSNESRCGPREVLAIGLPLVISTLSYSVMQFCDRLFLAWHSELEMAAVMPAVVLNWTATALPMGIAAYAATFVAQYFGSGNEKKIGAIVWMSFRLGIYFFPLFLLLAHYSENLFVAFGHSPQLIPLETIYFQIACLGSAAVVFEHALSAFYIGLGRTTMVMMINLFATAVNLVLDWCFIFGAAGIPEMGIEGAAWATTISVWLKVIIYFALIMLPANLQRFGLISGMKFDFALLKRLIRFGGPSGLQMWMEGMAISLFILFVGRLSYEATAATTLAFSVNLLAFIPVIGMGMSVSTLVGQQIGARRPDLAKRAVFNGMWISLLYTLVFGVLYFFTPQLFLMAHSWGAPHSPKIDETAIYLLKFVAAYCLFDTVQIIYSSALKGAGDTRFILWITFFNSVGFVVIGCVGAFALPVEFQLTWWWAIITSWILSYAIVFYWRYRNEKWTEMTVVDIESQPDSDRQIGESPVTVSDSQFSNLNELDSKSPSSENLST